MLSKTPDTAVKLTPRQRLTRGLTHTTTGTVDLARGAVGLGVQSARAGVAQLRERYRQNHLAREVAAVPEIAAKQLAAAQEVVTALPQALEQVYQSQRRGRRSRVLAAAVAVLLTAGGAAVVIIRRSSRPADPSLRPPSVDVQPRP